jgi:hypothetical protein
MARQVSELTMRIVARWTPGLRVLSPIRMMSSKGKQTAAEGIRSRHAIPLYDSLIAIKTRNPVRFQKKTQKCFANTSFFSYFVEQDAQKP